MLYFIVHGQTLQKNVKRRNFLSHSNAALRNSCILCYFYANRHHVITGFIYAEKIVKNKNFVKLTHFFFMLPVFGA